MKHFLQIRESLESVIVLYMSSFTLRKFIKIGSFW